MKILNACTVLAVTLLTPVLGAGPDRAADEAAATTKAAAKEEGVPARDPQKPMAKGEARPAPQKPGAGRSPDRKALGALNDRQLQAMMDATRKELTANARKHESSHADWVEAKKEAQAIEDEIAAHRKALADLAKKAGETGRKIQELEGVHAATEHDGETLQGALAAQERELARRNEIRKLEEQAAKLKEQAEALEKRAAQLR